MPEEQHARLSASAAERWIKCPGSLTLPGETKNDRSVYAQEGTVAHAIAAEMLTKFVVDDLPLEMCHAIPNKYAPHAMVDKHGNITSVALGVPGSLEITPENIEYIQTYFDSVATAFQTALAKDGNDPRLDIEQKVRVYGQEEVLWGTADAVLVSPTDGRLTVYDLKFGRGVLVEAENNAQLMIYGLAAWQQLTNSSTSIHHVELKIIQPRAYHPNGPIRSWVVSVDDLCRWRSEVLLPAVERVLQEDQTTVLGDWCKFCKRSTACPSTINELFPIIQDAVKTEPSQVQALPLDQLTWVVEHKTQLLQYVAACEMVLQDQLLAGETVPGFKLVKPNTRPVWVGTAADTLQTMLPPDEVFDRKIKSPTNIKTALARVFGKGGTPKAKEVVQSLTYKPDKGDLTLAPESDPRPAEQPGGVFGDIATVDGWLD